MNHEEHSKYVERQKAITKSARERVEASLRALDLNMILTDREKARKKFISAVVKSTDKYFNQSLENGRELKDAKLRV